MENVYIMEMKDIASGKNDRQIQRHLKSYVIFQQVCIVQTFLNV